MNSSIKEEVEKYLPNNETFSREVIFNTAKKVDPNFKKTRLRNLIEDLKEENKITHNGRNLYLKEGSHKKIYTREYSKKTKEIILYMEKRFPLLEYQIWELSWLNEFMNHQIMRNLIFVETEKLACGFVYNDLSDIYNKDILIHPSIDDITRYANSDDIIIETLISETPKNPIDKRQACLEKIIVDLFANKLLKQMISNADYPLAIQHMYEKYMVNTSALLRYARRRNKYREIKDFLTKHKIIK